MSTAHTVTVYKTQTQTKQNKCGSNNLIQFDWPDEQVGEGKDQFS